MHFGSHISEGRALAKYIREARLATVTRKACESACTLVFLAGSKRYLWEGGKLGFHSGSVGSVDSSQLPEINEEFRRAYESAGVPSWFIEKALSTRSSAMWYPSHQELRDAKIIDEVLQTQTPGSSEKTDSERLNSDLPKKIDSITTLVQIEIIGHMLMYKYIVAASALHVSPLANRDAFIDRVCNNIELRKAMRAGTRYAYRYTREGASEEGNLGTIYVTAESCGS